MSSRSQRAIAYVHDLVQNRFWGYLTLKFEDGTIVHMRREENLKPSEVAILPERNRGNHSESASN